MVSYEIYFAWQLWGVAEKALFTLPQTEGFSPRLFLMLTFISTVAAYIGFNTYEKFFEGEKTSPSKLTFGFV